MNNENEVKEEKKSEFEVDWENLGSLDDDQKMAITQALENPISIINGQAGTGKSFTIKALARQFKIEGWKVSLVAPTGKAALRIGGKTIHSWLEPKVEVLPNGDFRILGFSRKSFYFKEVLLIDESSMIDKSLWFEIFKIYDQSIHRDRKIVFIGDAGQLEPVGEGTPFLTTIEDEDFPITTLKNIHRTKGDNDIIEFADYVRNNKTIPSKPFNNVKKISKAEAIDIVYKDPINNQILSPMKGGDNGTDAINQLIQNKRKDAELISDTPLFIGKVYDNETNKYVDKTKFYEGDKVIVTKNYWPLEITNGTSGTVIGISTIYLDNKGQDDDWDGIIKNQRRKSVKAVEIQKEEDGSIIEIPLKWLEKNVDLAYSITVHKAQGSEYDKVFLFATQDQFMVRNKKLLYTAITRARQTVYVIRNG